MSRAFPRSSSSSSRADTPPSACSSTASSSPSVQDSILQALNDAGATYEGTGGAREGLYAVDLSPELDRTAVIGALGEAERTGLLECQEGGSPEFLQRCDRASETSNATVHHEAPLGDAPADAMLMAEVAGHELLEVHEWEQLWARAVDRDRFEVRNAPFYAYGLSFGDVVEVSQARDRVPVLREVVERSGRQVIRVYVFERGDRARIVANLERLGARAEEQAEGARLIAVDLPSQDVVEAVIDFLRPLEAREELAWESGWW